MTAEQTKAYQAAYRAKRRAKWKRLGVLNVARHARKPATKKWRYRKHRPTLRRVAFGAGVMWL